MAVLEFRKVTSLPGTLEADTFYFVVNVGYAESYVTSSSGVAKAIGNTEMINTLADARIAQALAQYNALEIVADIAERNALAIGATRSFMVLVLDASDDATVDAGAALYAYRESTQSFVKLTEYESLDVIVQWANIQGRPTSSPAQIDAAVAAAHTHANLATLDKIGEDGEGLTFDGQGVARWLAVDW